MALIDNKKSRLPDGSSLQDTDILDILRDPSGASLDYKLTGAQIKSSIGAALWPIGSIFVSVVSTNPATLLGFGTWVAFGTGRVLVGIDSGDADFDTVEETGGSKTI